MVAGPPIPNIHGVLDPDTPDGIKKLPSAPPLLECRERPPPPRLPRNAPPPPPPPPPPVVRIADDDDDPEDDDDDDDAAAAVIAAALLHAPGAITPGLRKYILTSTDPSPTSQIILWMR